MSKTLAIYQACLDDADVMQVSSQLTGSDLMTLKRILERHRKVFKSASMRGLQLETSVVEKAADMGDNEAIALLCYRTLSVPADQTTRNDRDHADRLLTDLLDRNVSFAFKVAGDLAYQAGQLAKAEQFYRLALNKGLPTLEAIVESWRSVGRLNMITGNKSKAQSAFVKAVSLAERLAHAEQFRISDCHLHLSRMARNANEQQNHLEKAAQCGLKEALAPLGHLYLQKGDKILAREYFKLGAEINDVPCLIGLYDFYKATSDPEFRAIESKLERLGAHQPSP